LYLIYFTNVDNGMSVIYGVALPVIIVGLIIVMYYLVKGKFFISKSDWKYALIISIPIIPHLISHQLLAQFDRFIVNVYDFDNLGFYSLALTMGSLIQIVINGINNAWTPWYLE